MPALFYLCSWGSLRNNKVMKIRLGILTLIILLVAVLFKTKNQEAVRPQASPPPQEMKSAESSSTLITTFSNEVKPQAAEPKIQNPDRQAVINLIAAVRSAQKYPHQVEAVEKFRYELNQLPNKKKVLWDYYKEIQARGASHLERVEILDLLAADSNGSDSELASASLNESLRYASVEVIHADQAKTQEEMNQALSTKTEWLPVIIAFELYVKNCGDFKVCELGIKQVLRKNQNHNLKNSLLQIVVQKFPAEARNLR